MTKLYFDYNATTPVHPSVRDVMLPFLSEHYGNPSSDHDLGRLCRDAIDRAREQVADLVGAQPREIVFTAGGTESNNLAIKGAMMGGSPSDAGHMVTSTMEHPAVAEPARFLVEMGHEVSVVGCNEIGIIDPEEVAGALSPDTRLVSIMHANNEIGSIQPIPEIGAICRAHGVLVHTDAAQSLGKIPVNVEEMHVDMLSLAGHKLYAPKGVGALYIRSGVTLRPYLHGAGHEGGIRPGTENVPYIVGLGEAARLAADGLEKRAGLQRELRDRLYQDLRAGIGDGVSMNGSAGQTLPNTLSINFPGVIGQELLHRVPALYASTGSACHSDRASMSETQLAIDMEPEVAAGTVRLSLGRQTTAEDVEQAASLLIGAWKELAES
jgi:cysteine desulfurase